MNNSIKQLYKDLLRKYGHQGWWPIYSVGYHQKDYSFPRNENEKFEVILGCILTQNTSWKNVEKAITNLALADCLNIKKINNLSNKKLAELIKPAGYYNQKAEYIKNIINFLNNNKNITRNSLLKVKGIGPETADSILLYAYKKAEFVVDSYTKRIILKLGLINEKYKYNDIKNLFEKNLKLDYKVFQEYHALLVEHGKNINL